MNRGGRIVAVVGPTGAGKSALAMRLAEALGAGIACCDSAQVYRGMDIGTAKPRAADRASISHSMLDLVDPDQSFTAAEYGDRLCADVEEGRAPPLVVGGTGFYLRSALWKMTPLPERSGADAAARAAFDAEWDERERATPGAIHAALDAVDPDAACEIHPRNLVRALRALWLCHAHGEAVSAVRRRYPPIRRLSALLIVVDPGVDVVDASIDARCDAMLAQGWVAEVENLRGRGYAPGLKSMQTLGYRQINAALDGALSLEEAREQIAAQTRAYARRQRTYFRHQLREEPTVEVSAKTVGSAALLTLAQRCGDFISGDTP